MKGYIYGVTLYLMALMTPLSAADLVLLPCTNDDAERTSEVTVVSWGALVTELKARVILEQIIVLRTSVGEGATLIREGGTDILSIRVPAKQLRGWANHSINEVVLVYSGRAIARSILLGADELKDTIKIAIPGLDNAPDLRDALRSPPPSPRE